MKVSKLSRRRFLGRSAIALPALGWSRPRLNSKPIVVSTWDSGRIANRAAWPVLVRGGKAIDAVEQAGIAIENEVVCCVGLGANPDRDGFVTLDACIMDEQSNCGGVAFLEGIKHPISVARKVMEDTPHVLLVGKGAQQFALEQGFELEPAELSPTAKKAYRKWLRRAKYEPVINIERTQKRKDGHGPFSPYRLEDGSFNHDTMGTIALDKNNDLSGMCTTSGMAFKMRGRVGDSPIIGAGLFVDNEVGAATSSGQGEEVIRVSGSMLVVEFMRSGSSPYEACRKAVERIVRRDAVKAQKFQVGFIAIDRQGNYGAYSIQPGFNYTVSTGSGQGVIFDADSHFT